MNSSDGVGERLRQTREWAGLSQQEAADITGIARAVISYWENERRTPSLAQLARLADAYGTTSTALLGQERPNQHVDEHALVYGGLEAQSTRTRGEVRRWLAFLDDWADLRKECGNHLPGRGRPPTRAWAAPRAITDSRRAAELATSVREHYVLGLDAIPDLSAFLDQNDVLVYRVSLDALEDSGVSGIFYNHPRLGYCILVNTNTTTGRQTFTLAHEFAHALFHYQETGLVSRAGDPDRKEKFADVFAAHFLVPSPTLRALARRDQEGYIHDPYEVIRLQRYFRVTYAMMLIRLNSDGLLRPAQFHAYKGYSPRDLAHHLGLDDQLSEREPSAGGVTLGTYPPSVLERVRSLIEQDELSPAAAASLLRVSQEAIRDQLLATPEHARPDEQREFRELPDFPSRRKTRVRRSA